MTALPAETLGRRVIYAIFKEKMECMGRHKVFTVKDAVLLADAMIFAEIAQLVQQRVAAIAAEAPPAAIPAPVGGNEGKQKASATPRKERPRNPLLDALVTMNGAKLEEVTGPTFAFAASALKVIHEVCPQVTAEEINRRAANYRARFPHMTLSPTALAKWWADCGVAEPVKQGSSARPKQDYTKFM